jgi:anti-sigma factor RsiW
MSTHPGDQDLGRASEDGPQAEHGPEYAPGIEVDGPSCLAFVESLDDYLVGELTAVRRRAFEAHLATCPLCRNYLGAYQKTIELSRSAVLASDELEGAALDPELILAILSAPGS